MTLLLQVRIVDVGGGIRVDEARGLANAVKRATECEVVVDGHAREAGDPGDALGSSGTAYDLLELAIQSGAVGALGVSALRALSDVIVAGIREKSERRVEVVRPDGSSVTVEGRAATRAAVEQALHGTT